MKQKYRLFSLVGLCLFFILSSCVEEDLSAFGDDFDIPELTDDNTIQFTVEAGGGQEEIQLTASGGRVAIEWGDGRIQKIENSEEGGMIRYKHGNLRKYRIRIWAEELLYCGIGSTLRPVSDVHIGNLPMMKSLQLESVIATSELKLNTCPNLEDFYFGNMPDLKLLDISQCKRVKHLSIYNNPQLTSLDVSNQSELEQLNCTGNGMTTLSLKGLKKLREVNCNFNAKLSTLELDDVTVISALFIDGCAFRSLTIFDKLSSLMELSCSSNQLTELDLSKHDWVRYVSCDNNQIKRLKISPWNYSLQSLNCSNNQLDEGELNTLFNALRPAGDPQYAGMHSICFYDNPGEGACDSYIPLGKGWRIDQKVFGEN